MIHLVEELFYSKHEFLVAMLKELGYEYQVVSIPLRSEQIIYEPLNTTKVFCWGSVKMARIAAKYGWTPGSLYNDNHDYQVYSLYYRENMLNWDSQIIQFSEPFEEPGFLFHVRPCADTKSFTGQVFTRASWDEFLAWNLANPEKTRLKSDTIIQVSRLQNIHREVRFFILNKQIVSASQYKVNNLHDEERTDASTDPELFAFVEQMIQIYSVAEGFVMDIATTDNGYKIIEINCFNSSGYYDCNLKDIVTSVQEYFV